MSKRVLIAVAVIVLVVAGGSIVVFKRTMQKGMADREGRVLAPPKAPAK